MADFPPGRRVSLPDRVSASAAREPGITLSVHEAGAGPAVVLCHGFPELAYSWRHQFPALAAAGFRVIAPDQRGYGGSDAPEPIEAYDLERLTGDLVALLDALGLDRAVFVGPDWGGFVAWAMPVLHPDRGAGVIGVNTPYMALPTTRVLPRARTLALPCLMITAEWDFALPPELAAGMPALCSDLEMHLIRECGHWTQQERPEELNLLMTDWLVRRFRAVR